jgi:VWFA-related protein
MPRRAALITTIALFVTALGPLLTWNGEHAIVLASGTETYRSEAGGGPSVATEAVLNASGGRLAQSSKRQPSRQPFRSGALVVQVSVLARDQAGRPITDLTRADVTVTEEGTPQEIVAFDRISVPRVHIAESPSASAVGPAQDVSTNEAIDSARVFVLVMDALHIAPARNIAVRRYARQFIEQYMGPGDLAAVLSPGGLPSATEDFTSDKARLLAAIDHFSGTKLTSATVERDEESRRFYDGVPMHGGKDPDDGERANRASSLTRTLEAIAVHAERIEGRRKALLLFSEGIDYDTSDIMGESQRYATEVTRAMGGAAGALMRTNVVLYSIDPRVLSTAQADIIETPIYERNPGKPGGFSERGIEEEFAASIRSLRDMAQATGGFLATDKGIGRAFDQIVEETSEYYVLGYTPARPARPGESRSLTVTTSRRGVTLVARKGYVMPQREGIVMSQAEDPITGMGGGSPRQRRNMPAGVLSTTAAPASTAGVPGPLAQLLASPLPKPGLPLRVQAIPFMGGDGKALVQLVVEVLGAGLQFDERGGRAHERIDVALLTVDSRGKAANGRTTAIDLNLPAEELARVRTTGVRWLSKLDLSPGQYQVRVAAAAAGSGTSGLVTTDVEVPGFDRQKLTMSGVTLTSLPSVLMLTRGKAWLEATLETPPSAARAFVAGDRVTAAVQIYGPEPVLTRGEVVAAVEAAGSDLLALKGVPGPIGRSGNRDVVFTLDTATLPKGTYVLRISATVPGSSERVERRVPFRVV